MLIRRETPDDRDAVFDVHNTAFATNDGSVAYEATLVDALRTAGDVVAALSLVAEVDGQVAGHVVCSRARLGDGPSLGLGPLGVVPELQGRGVGSALVHAVLGAADALEAPAVILLGAPGYYERFGFESAEALGVTAPDPTWAQHFQIRTLTTWSAAYRGAFRYAAAFGIE